MRSVFPKRQGTLCVFKLSDFRDGFVDTVDDIEGFLCLDGFADLREVCVFEDPRHHDGLGPAGDPFFRHIQIRGARRIVKGEAFHLI